MLVYLCLAMFTLVDLCLHLLTYVYTCLHMFTPVYLCLPTFTDVYLLTIFTCASLGPQQKINMHKFSFSLVNYLSNIDNDNNKTLELIIQHSFWRESLKTASS